MKHIVIIGNGISGITAARSIRKRSNDNITVISGETEHFFSRTALMYIYMGHMKYENTKPYEDWFWKKNRIELVKDYVEKVDSESKKLILRNRGNFKYDILIIASGSKSNKFGWPGQDLKGVQGLYSFQDLELMEQNSKGIKHAVIVGGGLIGIEMAEMLLTRKIGVTILVRENEFWSNVLPIQEANLISRHVRSHHVDLRLNIELKEIQSDGNGKVKSIVTNKGETIECQFVGLTVGVSPNIDFLKNSGIETKRGVLVNEYLETNVPNVYALGDCVERKHDLPGRRNIEQVWYTGRMMGEVVAQTICGEKTKYEPGPWFNSAKFFDIEYQTYGNVWNELKSNEMEFYWEHASGTKCVHVVWDKLTNQFLGINTFGIRMRHECFDKWLREKRSIDFVIEHLAEANFDPEFFSRHEDEIVSEYKKVTSLISQ
ncbi:MAG: NAD(P)/FAD-dependent oxidoreductase [Cytophagales bacterium]|nr:NAD(P)/FAD-dependent oxidoreductase [Cytophagales bacterium]MCA6365572.1 NAD(P)/FAD-dependent oxidoreductase [Cytophagales bacterium]MCA6372515.1 NAD(P)/FAD-dependent oxidoreductase [Cytophagales bacterium]MCA6374291.1 NAD(P)/FAD-dependent oxidoreductase [Cytophagales bacterium]MCA6383206.1 NAD(P)/FAD-dependent oxidoreductase [Cytophagales bacterium]